MSRISARAYLLLGAAALALRLGAAVLTEFHPVFPAYYYTDAVIIDESAAEALEARRTGHVYRIPVSLPQRIQVEILSRLYAVTGRRPLVGKVFNAVLGALAATLLTAAFAPAFGTAALVAGWLFALWPSCVFFTSQNFKESPVCAFAFASFAAMAPLLTDKNASSRRIVAQAMLAAATLLAAGFFRPPVLLSAVAAIAGAVLAEAARTRLLRPSRIAALAACLIAPAVYVPLSAVLKNYGFDRQVYIGDTKQAQETMVPKIYDPYGSAAMQSPTSPSGITAFRRVRIDADRRWAEIHSDRKIGTQIYPEAAFTSWLEVAAFLPKGAFTALFQPLPGFYPLEGKPGRLAAALENLLLLALAAAALMGVGRGRFSAAEIAPLAFFLILTAAAGLLELDLGSASRHKILYLPMLFPFAARFLLRSKERA